MSYKLFLFFIFSYQFLHGQLIPNADYYHRFVEEHKIAMVQIVDSTTKGQVLFSELYYDKIGRLTKTIRYSYSDGNEIKSISSNDSIRYHVNIYGDIDSILHYRMSNENHWEPTSASIYFRQTDGRLDSVYRLVYSTNENPKKATWYFYLRYIHTYSFNECHTIAFSGDEGRTPFAQYIYFPNSENFEKYYWHQGNIFQVNHCKTYYQADLTMISYFRYNLNQVSTIEEMSSYDKHPSDETIKQNISTIQYYDRLGNILSPPNEATHSFNEIHLPIYSHLSLKVEPLLDFPYQYDYEYEIKRHYYYTFYP